MRPASADSGAFPIPAPLPRAAGSEPIAGYRLVEFLGRGGFGEVWKCEAPGGLFKAIKFVNGNRSGLEADAAQAWQELDALQRVKAIRHPFILSLDRLEIVNGELVIVMELADRSLHDRFVECQSVLEPGIPRDELLGYMMEAAEALDVMNLRHGLPHLNIKPGNLFLVADHVKVADFGLVNRVSHVKPGEALGIVGGITPLYSAPETFLGNLSPQSDQYSLAIVYHLLLTGKLPFDASNAQQLALQHANQPPDLELLTEAERPLLARALAKNPDERFPSCLEFVHGLMLAGSSRPANRDGGGKNRPDTSQLLRFALRGMARGNHAAPAPRRDANDTPVDRATRTETLSGQQAPAASHHVLPGFKFLALFGQTPFGEVWHVQAPDGRPRLLRFLPALPGRDPAHERAILDALCNLSHPAFPETQLIELEPGRFVLLTERLEQSIVDRCRVAQGQHSPGIPRGELLGYVWAAAEALDYLHTEEALHHLGLAPHVFALADDRLVIKDAGLAELFGAGEPLRRIQAARYAAPELFESQFSAASDQYSLAVIYSELLSGLHPFRGQGFHRLGNGRNRPRPDLDLLPSTDRRVVARALQHDPAARYASCSEFVRALELGEPDQLQSLPNVFVDVEEIADETAQSSLANDPAHAVDRLHHLLEELAGDVASALRPSKAAHRRGLQMEQRCGARVYGPAARIKLEGFRQQWRANIRYVEPARIVLQVPISHSFWRRCLGKDPTGLEVTFAFQQPHTVAAQLTEVIIHVRPLHVGGKEGKRLLHEVGPLLLDSARSYLQATPERRGLERLKFTEPVQIMPVVPGRQPGPALDGTGKDICMRGVGVLARSDPRSREVMVALPAKDSPEPILLPAEIVRVHRRTDQLYEIGARFAFGGFGGARS